MKNARVWTLVIIVGLVLTPQSLARDQRLGTEAGSASLVGQFLVSSPDIGDPRFARTVIYIIAHDADGAMGLVVNRTYGSGPLKSLLEGFGIESKRASGRVILHYGGPVEIERGFVLHTSDYGDPTTQRIDGRVAVSTGIEVLEAIAAGRGPRKSTFVLGYAGWGPGQLEGEIARDDWLTVPADAALIFSDDVDSVWDKARRRAGMAL